MSEFNSIFDVICSRRSCDTFRRKGVERAKVGKMLEAARWAPSPGNIQSWEFIVVEDAELKEQVSKIAHKNKAILDSPMSIVVLSNLTRAIARYGKSSAEKYALQECGACVQNMLLVAHEEGLGTCWIGDFQTKKLVELLKIPETVLPVAIISVGYSTGDYNYKERFKYKITEVTFWNEYGVRVSPIYDEFEWKGLQHYGRRTKKRLFKKW